MRLFTKKVHQYLFQGLILMIMLLNSSECEALLNAEHYSTHPTQQELKPYVVISTEAPVGFFAEFEAILGALKLYDQGILAGVSLEYETTGAYYDAAVGPNWWEYYFESVHVGNRENGILTPCHFTILVNNILYEFPWLIELYTSRKDAHDLITKFIKVKPHIAEKVNQIVKESFGHSTIIGVHYRGTDKCGEALRAPYENVAAHVDETIVELEEIGHDHIKIFVATDEQDFLDYMRERYPLKIVCYEESERSVDGVCVHLSGRGGTPYKKGEDALIDCLLLSKTDILLKTSSNLSQCASYFNPDIPVVHITTRPWWTNPLQ